MVVVAAPPPHQADKKIARIKHSNVRIVAKIGGVPNPGNRRKRRRGDEEPSPQARALRSIFTVRKDKAEGERAKDCGQDSLHQPPYVSDFGSGNEQGVQRWRGDVVCSY